MKHVAELFGTAAVVLLEEDGELVARAGTSALVAAPRDRAVARWVLEHDHPAGHGTDTLPGCDMTLIPLGTAGVLGVAPRRVPLSRAESERLHGVASEAAIALERCRITGELLLQELERQRRSLLRSVSHDLRRPLSSILGCAEVLLSHSSDDDDRELLESIHHEAARLARYVSDLMLLAQLLTGDRTVHPEWVPLEEIIVSALERAGALLAHREIAIAVPDDVALVYADPALLDEALGRLIDNAAIHTTGPIEIRAAVRDQWAILEVSDRGPGLPHGIDVFGKLYRAGDRRTTGGPGLGLAICQPIVRAQGVRLRAENRGDGGATFSLEIPLPMSAPSL